ncbi:MAG: FecR domain-containing protein [Bradyrhizobium sp.]
MLFNGDFTRSGVDLILSADDQKLVLHDYFKGEKRAALASPDGAHLTGDIVKALAGHVEYAQAADGSASVNKVIGHVTKLAGTATAIRNGVSIILNQGDNVEKGDVVQSGSGSTLGITFIDGTVFGLSSNARMVLNEMVYDPNGSSNSSLLSLVAGTITFVAGETAKHGDMKIDTPVATMGIRGTAVLVEIDFDTAGQNGLPDTKFQVLVEPDGTTGSYILFDKVTLTPFAVVDRAGTQFSFSNGNFSQSLTGLTPEVQKLITDVFAQKFTDNSNPRTFDHHTDTPIPDSFSPFKVGNVTVTPVILLVNAPVNTPAPAAIGLGPQIQHIDGPPGGVIVNANGQASTDFRITEIPGVTGSHTPDKVSGAVNFVDINAGDQPTVSAKFDGSAYTDPHGHALSLNAQQLADIKAVEVDLVVTATPGNNNNGSASWSYTVPDGSFDFLAAGETLQLTYTLTVDNNYAPHDESTPLKFTITITGTNDVPVITTAAQTINFSGGKTTVGGDLAPTSETSGVSVNHPSALSYSEKGTLSFTDPDLTDTHSIVVPGQTGDLTGASLAGVPLDLAAFQQQFPLPFQIFENALSATIGTDSTGTGTGTINWTFAELPAYVADFIPSGETLTLTYTVEVRDSQGAISTQTITVTVTGNDTPAVVWKDVAPAPPSGALWSNGSNWGTGNAPTIADDTIIITNQLQPNTPTYPVVIDSAASAKSLVMDDPAGLLAPELDNKDTLTIAGGLNMSADAILKNFGTLSVGSLAALLSISGLAEFSDHSVLNNSGTIKLAQGGDFLDHSSITNSGTIEISGDKLNVEVAIANAGGAIQVDGGVALNVNDGAVITKGNLTIGSLGVLDIEKGTATLAVGTPDATLDGVTVTGTDAVTGLPGTPASLIEIGATTSGVTLLLDDGTTIKNGTLTMAGGSKLDVESTGGATLDGVSVTGTGTTGPSASLIEIGASTTSGSILTLDDGTIIKNGALTIAIGSTLDIESTGGATLDGVTVSGGGAINVDGEVGGPPPPTPIPATLKLQGGTSITGGTLTNGSVGTVDVESTGGATLDGVNVTGTGTTGLSASLIEIGASTTSGSILTLDDGTTIKNGALTIAGGSKLDVESTGGATLDGVSLTGTTGPSASLIEIGASTTSGSILTLDDGTTIKNGTLTIASGSKLDVESTGGATLDGVNVTGTTGPSASLIEIGASTTSGSILTLDDGTIIKNGTLTIAGGSKLDVESTGGATLDGVSVTGTTGPSASLIEIGASTTSGSILTLDDGTTIKNGTLTIAGGSALDVESTGGATLDGVNVTGTTGPSASLIEIGASTTSGLILTLDDGTTIKNGTLTIAGGSKLDVESAGGATLDGVSVTGTGTTGLSASLIEIGAGTISGSILTLDDGTTIKNGALTIAGGSKLDVESTGGATLDGVSLTGTTGPSASLIEIGASTTSGSILTLDDGTTIKNGALTIAGSSKLDVESTGGATLDGVSVTGTTGPSASLIEIGASTTSGSILTLDDGTILKNGTMTIAAGSKLDVESTGATLDGVSITGTTGPSASLIEIGASTTSGSILMLEDGTHIKNGALTIATGSALDIEGIGGATLDGVTVSGGGAINVDGPVGPPSPTPIPAMLTLQGGTSITGGTLANGIVGTVDVESVSGATLDDVTVIGGGTIEVGETTSGAILTLTDGTTVTPSTLDIATGGEVHIQAGANGHGVTFDGVKVSSVGTLSISDGATLTLDDASSITGGKLIFADSSDKVFVGSGGATLDDVTVTGGGEIDVGSAAAAGAMLTLDDGGSITGGKLVFADSSDKVFVGSGGTTLNNVTITGGETDVGSATATGVTLTLDGGGSIADGTLVFADSSDKVFVGSGGATLDGVTITGGGEIDVGSTTATDVTLTLEGATVIKNGNLTIANGSTLDVESVGGATLDGVTVANGGHIDIGTATASTAEDPPLTLDDHTVITGGTMTMGSLGVLDIEKGAAVLAPGTPDATLDDVTVTSSAVGSAIMIGAFGAATLLLTDGASTSNVDITVNAGSTLDLDSSTITSGTLTISGELDSTGTSFITDATIINSSHIDIVSGTLTIDPTPVTNSGTIEVNVGSTLVLSGEVITNSVTTADGTTKGIIQVDAIDSTHFATLHLDGSTIDGGTITISGELDSTGDSFITGATITNTGTIDVTGGTLTIDATSTFDNTHGVLETNGGHLIINAAIVGDLEIKDGAVLELGSSLANAYSQVTVTFDPGAMGTLKLDHSQGFGGTISGFGAGDVIDLADLTYSATESYVWNGAANTLTISNGNQTDTLKLAGTYSQSSFALASDAYGNTELVSNPAQASVANLDYGHHAEQGSALIAVLIDAHASDITYQWLDNGVPISGATGSSYVPTTADLHKTIDVIIGFTDGGTTEHVTALGGSVITPPVIVGEANPPTETVILAKSPIVLGPGVDTNSLHLGTESFDSLQAGTVSDNGAGFGSFFSSNLGATFTASGNAGVVHGSSGVSAAPFMGPVPGRADTTNYLSIGAHGSETISFASEQNEFGLYWGSVDSFNTINFYNGTTLVASYSGADISPLLSNGNQGSFASNGYVEFSDLSPFNKVVLATGGSNAFEIDNVSAGFTSDSHIQLATPITGTITVSDADVGDTLTASVIGGGVVKYDGSTTLPSDANVAALIDPHAITFDSVTTTAGQDTLHWTYNPTNADIDFLEPSDTLTVTFEAKVTDGHATTVEQPLTVTIVGTGASVVNGTAQNDTFINIGGNVTIFGKGGQDTFVFKPNFGSATIADFSVNNDTIDIDHTLFANTTLLLAGAHSANAGHDVILTDAAHDTITLKNLSLDQLKFAAQHGDFHFT